MAVGDAIRDWAQQTLRSRGVSVRRSDDFDRFPTIQSIRFFGTSGRRVQISRTQPSPMFGGKTKIQTGLRWYEYGRLAPRFSGSRRPPRTSDKLQTPLSITVFAFVATHNHFVLDRGGRVFNRSAPVIKLAADATENDHLRLVGLLNSSTACFWMQIRGVLQQGGRLEVQQTTTRVGGAHSKDEKWHDFYEHDGRNEATATSRYLTIRRSISRENLTSSPRNGAKTLPALVRMVGKGIPSEKSSARTTLTSAAALAGRDRALRSFDYSQRWMCPARMNSTGAATGSTVSCTGSARRTLYACGRRYARYLPW